jgi:hypothetical protein
MTFVPGGALSDGFTCAKAADAKQRTIATRMSAFDMRPE